MTPAPDERERIRAAMDRILAGAPHRSTGALTIVALAEEAGVPRNALTQRHLDLKNHFYEAVRARGRMPDNERRLRQQITKLKELRARDAEKLAQLRQDVEYLVYAFHELSADNHQLRTAAAALHGHVRALPTTRPADARPGEKPSGAPAAPGS
ncbi:hypothetical protein AB0I94_36195 [Streptomyces sp. NPDC050147]|uniref:hypothetical protein n=1 Tax=Streptomyces sp. NPDC050147 TaxID=3155513 RepID=UPI0034307C96